MPASFNTINLQLFFLLNCFISNQIFLLKRKETFSTLVVGASSASCFCRKAQNRRAENIFYCSSGSFVGGGEHATSLRQQ